MKWGQGSYWSQLTSYFELTLLFQTSCVMNERYKTYKMCTTLNYDREMEKYLNTIFGNLRALEEIRRTRVSRKCEKLRQISNTERSEPVFTKLTRETVPEKISQWTRFYGTHCKSESHTQVPDGMQQLLVRRERVWYEREANKSW